MLNRYYNTVNIKVKLLNKNICSIIACNNVLKYTNFYGLKSCQEVTKHIIITTPKIKL